MNTPKLLTEAISRRKTNQANATMLIDGIDVHMKELLPHLKIRNGAAACSYTRHPASIDIQMKGDEPATIQIVSMMTGDIAILKGGYDVGRFKSSVDAVNAILDIFVTQRDFAFPS